MNYLYGASVQGIQNFIFQTNELKDIAGASEVVEEICTVLFAKLLYGDDALNYQAAKQKLEKDTGAIVYAAGNIRYVFNDKASASRVVLAFPQLVSNFAPGITISQAVIEYEGNDLTSVVSRLEQNLKVQRNKPLVSTEIAPMGVLRSRQTGGAVVKIEGDDFLDAASCEKRKRNTTYNLSNKAFGREMKHSQIAYNCSDLTEKNDWLAVVHADGNDMGRVVAKLGLNKTFSSELDKSTVNASISASEFIREKFSIKDENKFPIRPVVLGGDDLTIICRADVAIPFVEKFMQEFERETKERLGDLLVKNSLPDCLTVCAGISYVKSSFPFYYAYKLAAQLCSKAKSDARALSPTASKSCLMFHKVQDSFVSDFASIERRELQPNKNTSFKFGPYYLNEMSSRWTISTFMECVSLLGGKSGNAVKSHLRQWLSLLNRDEGMAEQKLARLLSIVPQKDVSKIKNIVEGCDRVVGKDSKKTKVLPTYDILAINSINNQKTK
jgi:hypothetical protein